jgi:hypothetical protein
VRPSHLLDREVFDFNRLPPSRERVGQVAELEEDSLL